MDFDKLIVFSILIVWLFFSCKGLLCKQDICLQNYLRVKLPAILRQNKSTWDYETPNICKILWTPILKTLHNQSVMELFQPFLRKCIKKRPCYKVCSTKVMFCCHFHPLLPGATTLCWEIRSPAHHLTLGEKGTPF